MYEELTILEQKAASNNSMKGETSKFGDPKYSSTTKSQSKLESRTNSKSGLRTKTLRKGTKSPTDIPKKDSKSGKTKKEGKVITQKVH